MNSISKTNAILRHAACIGSLPPDETDRPDRAGVKQRARWRRHGAIWRGFACFALGLTLGMTGVLLAAPAEEIGTLASLSDPGG